jgi:predicted ArsR family transcriptional regulator
VLQALRTAGPDASVNDIATRVGLHPNTVRWHLDRLVQAGLATRASAVPNKPGRPPIHFTAAPKASVGGADAADQDGYRALRH